MVLLFRISLVKKGNFSLLPDCRYFVLLNCTESLTGSLVYVHNDVRHDERYNLLVCQLF